MLGVVLGQGQNRKGGRIVPDLVEDVDEQTEEQEAEEDGEDDDPQRDALAAFCLGPLHGCGHLGSKAGGHWEAISPSRLHGVPTCQWT